MSAHGDRGKWRGVWERFVRHELVVAVVVLVMVLALAFPDIIFGGKTLLGGASGVMGLAPPYGFEGEERVDDFRLDKGASAWQTEPWTRKVRQAYGDGDIPLWNPNAGAGAPLLANMQSAVFNPLRLPVLISPSPSVWDLYLLGRFLLGGLLAFLFARQMGMVLPAGLVTAVGYTFSGYFMIYSNNHWLEVYLVLPLVLYGVETIVRHGRAGGAVLLATAVAFNLLAGMPEPSFLTLLLAGGYAAYRLAFSALEGAGRRATAQRGLLLSAGFVAGFALAAPVLLPFWEYVRNAYTAHTPGSNFGLGFDSPRLSISLLIPFFSGDPLNSVDGTGWSGIRNYVGVVLPFLAILGLWHRPLARRAGWFFLAAALLALAKTYGVPGINDLGRLPIADLTGFPPWIAPVPAFCLAFLAGAGADRVFRGESLGSSLHLAAAVVVAAILFLLVLNRDILDTLPRPERLWTGLAFGLVLAVWALLRWGGRLGTGKALHQAGAQVLAGLLILLFLNWDMANDLAMEDWLGKVGLGIGLMVVVWALVWFGRHQGTKQLGWACLALVAGEMLVFAPHGIYRDRYDTFVKPPYVEFLQERQAEEGRGRVFGFDALLFPNDASAYDLDDVRDLDALYLDRYISYLRTFISPSVLDRFVGGPYASRESIAQVSNNPMFDLMGAKYILTGPNGLDASTPQPLIDEIIAEVGETPEVRHLGFVINGVEKPVLFAHAPSEIPYEVIPAPERNVLRFSVALDPASWEGGGDGVTFDVVVVRGSDPTIVWGRSVDPTTNPADRRWIDGAVDLSPYTGQTVTVYLRTMAGENTAWDWSGWGDLRLGGRVEAGSGPSQFELAYDGEVRIYENLDALPRAFVLHRVDEAADEDAALVRMQQHDFDPAGLAVVEGPLPASVRQELAEAPESDDSQVSITRYEDNRVELEARMENAGLVLLTDAYFPGWKVYVDGEQANIYPTDYLFRGVFVSEGDHKIEFVYDPAPFKLGVAISVIALVALLGLWGVGRYLQRKPKDTANVPDTAKG